MLHEEGMDRTKNAKQIEGFRERQRGYVGHKVCKYIRKYLSEFIAKATVVSACAYLISSSPIAIVYQRSTLNSPQGLFITQYHYGTLSHQAPSSALTFFIKMFHPDPGLLWVDHRVGQLELRNVYTCNSLNLASIFELIAKFVI